MRAQEESIRLLEQFLPAAAQGADAAEVALCGGRAAHTAFTERGALVTEASAEDRLRVRIWRGARWMQASTTDVSEAGLDVVLARCREAIGGAEGAVPALPTGASFPGGQSYHLPTARADALDRAQVVGHVQRHALRHGLRARGTVRIRTGTEAARAYALANTAGLRAYHPSTHAALTVRFSGANGLVGQEHAEHAALAAIDVPELVERAAARVVHGHAPKRAPTGAHVAVLEPPATAAVLAAWAELIRRPPEHQVPGASLGSTYGDAQIESNPRHAALRGRPFDERGSPVDALHLIDGGTPSGAAWSAFAQRTERSAHLVWDAGTAALGALVAATDAGIMVPRLERCTLVDERYGTLLAWASDGSFQIEGGQVVRPLRAGPVRIRLRDFWQSFQDGTPAVAIRGTAAPAIRVGPLEFGR